jgi:hypothetical protein
MPLSFVRIAGQLESHSHVRMDGFQVPQADAIEDPAYDELAAPLSDLRIIGQ